MARIRRERRLRPAVALCAAPGRGRPHPSSSSSSGCRQSCDSRRDRPACASAAPGDAEHRPPPACSERPGLYERGAAGQVVRRMRGQQPHQLRGHLPLVWRAAGQWLRQRWWHTTPHQTASADGGDRPPPRRREGGIDRGSRTWRCMPQRVACSTFDAVKLGCLRSRGRRRARQGLRRVWLAKHRDECDVCCVRRAIGWS